MQIGMIGFGRMGGNMARRPVRRGCAVVGFDERAATRARLAYGDELLAKTRQRVCGQALQKEQP